MYTNYNKKVKGKTGFHFDSWILLKTDQINLVRTPGESQVNVRSKYCKPVFSGQTETKQSRLHLISQ